MSDDPASLQNLYDIVVPLPVPWWPPAPGWYWLTGAVLLAVAWLIWRGIRRHRAEAYRRAALTQIATLVKRTQQDGDITALHPLPGLLKRTALAAYPRERVAALSGSAWWAFLDETAGNKVFTSGGGRLLDSIAYEPDRRLDTTEREALLAAAEGWLRGHRRDAGHPSC